jgi:hypothetical protein
MMPATPCVSEGKDKLTLRVNQAHLKVFHSVFGHPPPSKRGPATGSTEEMTATAVKQKPIAGIAVPIVAALTVAGIGIAPRAVGPGWKSRPTASPDGGHTE